jgi:hypothetical protein
MMGRMANNKGMMKDMMMQMHNKGIMSSECMQSCMKNMEGMNMEVGMMQGNGKMDGMQDKNDASGETHSDHH